MSNIVSETALIRPNVFTQWDITSSNTKVCHIWMYQVMKKHQNLRSWNETLFSSFSDISIVTFILSAVTNLQQTHESSNMSYRFLLGGILPLNTKVIVYHYLTELAAFLFFVIWVTILGGGGGDGDINESSLSSSSFLIKTKNLILKWLI